MYYRCGCIATLPPPPPKKIIINESAQYMYLQGPNAVHGLYKCVELQTFQWIFGKALCIQCAHDPMRTYHRSNGRYIHGHTAA